jgi:hypothetical protein
MEVLNFGERPDGPLTELQFGTVPEDVIGLM